MALVDNAWYVNFGNGSSTGYYAVAAWAALTTFDCGALVRQLAAPAVGSERVFVCIAGHVASGAAEPTWTITRGGKTTDATITWQEATGIAALNGDKTNTPTWNTVKNTAVTLGQVIQSVNGNFILICTTAGTAGNGAEPTWAAYTTAGATTADNTVTWTTLKDSGNNFTGWSAPHARLGSAFTTNWGQAGNAFFLATEHAETQASANTLSPPGSFATQAFIYSVTKTTVPPVTVSAGASITTTGANGITLGGFTSYWYGITFNCGSGAVANDFTLAPNASTVNIMLDGCAINKLGTTASTSSLIFGGTNQNVRQIVTLNNTTIQFGNTSAGDGILLRSCLFIWKNTPSAITGASNTVPSTLFNTNSTIYIFNAFLSGVDLSASTSKTLVGAMGVACNILLQDCKLGTSTTISATPSGPGQVTNLVTSDSGATIYRAEKYLYEGTQTVETTIVRTGGATDGTTPISWKCASTANSKWVFPFESQPIAVWNTSTSAITTLTFYGTTTGGGVPNDDDVWIEVEYPGSGSTPQGSFITTTKASNLAASAATNNSSDSSTWGGGGAGNGFKIVVPSFTPGMAGPINITIKVAKVSTTYYIDPWPTIGGVKVTANSTIIAPGVYTSGLASGAAGMLFIPNMDGT